MGVLPDREPGREELSRGRSTAGLAESMLSLGLRSPAVEPDLWGVDEPDLKPTASTMSSEDVSREGQNETCIYCSRRRQKGFLSAKETQRRLQPLNTKRSAALRLHMAPFHKHFNF